jgi:ribonuclease P protein component
MLPSKARLRFREVEDVFAKGERRTAPLFSITFLKPSDRTAFAVTVSKKVAKNASDRNKIRRRIYSAISKIRKDNLVFAHVVFLPKKEVLKASAEILETEIKKILARATILP